MSRKGERSYPIKTHEPYGFWTGLTPGNKQVLMGLLCPNLVAFFFDAGGTLLAVEQRPLALFQGVAPPYDIYDERIPGEVASWQSEMGLRPAPIKVKKFFTQEPYAGIEDYPDHFGEVLSDPEAGRAEKEDVCESMRLWDKDGQFVLQWGNDYWLDDTGEVVSS
jgi:hypothetical protein